MNLRFASLRAFVCALAFLTHACLQAANYYVSPTGSDSNAGTSTGAPWKTLTKVNSRNYAAGDIINLLGGSTFSGSLTFTASSTGTAANPVKVTTYGTGKATINAGTGVGIYIFNTGGLTLNNLILSGGWVASSQSGNTSAGIYAYTTKPSNNHLPKISITNTEVKGFKAGGIVFYAAASDGTQSGFDSVTINGCSIHDNGHVGITTSGPVGTSGSTAYAYTNVYVGYTSVYLNQGLTGQSNHSGNGILIGDANGGTIEHCVAYQNGGLSTYVSAGPCGIWCWDSTNLVFQYNESHHNSSGAGTADGDGFDLDGGTTNCVMQYNYSHDNKGAGFLLYEFGAPRVVNQSNTVRFNVSENDSAGSTTYGGLYIGGTCTNNIVNNNSVYNVSRPPLVVAGGSGNWFINNLFFSNSSTNYAIYLQSNACWLLNNDYWSGAYSLRLYNAGTTLTSLAALRATGQEVIGSVNYGFNVDPQLTAPGTADTINTGTPSTLTAYRLLSTSPLKSVGYDLRTLGFAIGATNFFLTAIPPIDVGAD